MNVASRHVATALIVGMCGLMAASPSGHTHETAGTRRMAARLSELAASLDPSVNPILNTARAERLRIQFEGATEPVARLQARLGLGYELLLAGKTLEAIDQLVSLRGDVAPYDPKGRVRQRVSELIATAYLRLGEQENCINRHNSDSCLLPIRGSGVYTHERATRRAIQEYTALLESSPDDLAFRWLLNLAYMTLGEHPGKVPAQFLIPPAVFASDYDLPRFVDVAPRLGLALTGRAGGSVMEDFDGDGHLDLLASSWGLTEQIRLLHNNGDGTFVERTAEAGLTGETGGLNLVHADYDNDGHQDVLVLRGAWLGIVGQGNHPSSLLRNRGDGTFDDVTDEAGLLRDRPTQTAAWADYDGDGWLDLVIGVEATGPLGARSELHHNNRDGTFTEVAAAAGLAFSGFVKGVTWGDYNNDGRPDLYVSRFGQSNLLFRNDGPPEAAAEGSVPPKRWRFTDVTRAAHVEHPVNSFATWFWDYDNDGWQDLFVAPFLGFNGRNLVTAVRGYLGHPNNGETPRLYRNMRDGTFEDVTGAMNLAKPLVVMGANFGDLDNDGFPDMYLGTGEPDFSTLVPNRMFRNDGGRRFQDVTSSGGFGHLQKGHGISFGDVDNDGDQDVYAVMGGAYEGDVYPNVLFLNPGNRSHWITLRLEGTRSNRSAIGARITVAVETAEGAREIHGTVGSGGSFGGSPLRQTIGLGGSAYAVTFVEVRWPGSGTIQRFEGVAMNRMYSAREGRETLVPFTVKTLGLDAPAPR